MLFDRDVELAAIDAAIARGERGAGNLLYIEGHPGMGKTRLIEAARSRAEGRGRVLYACGGELEHDFSYGVVR